MTKKEEEFLRESNAIEEVWDAQSLVDAGIAWKYIKSQKTLTTSAIKKMHRLLMRGKLEKEYLGFYRDVPVHVGGRDVTPAFYINEFMQEWTKEANMEMNEMEIAHHHIRYEYIHPFIDGNGRTGRMLFNWQRMRNGFPIVTIWEKHKNKYYAWFGRRPHITQAVLINKHFGFRIF